MEAKNFGWYLPRDTNIITIMITNIIVLTLMILQLQVVATTREYVFNLGIVLQQMGVVVDTYDPIGKAAHKQQARWIGGNKAEIFGDILHFSVFPSISQFFPVSQYFPVFASSKAGAKIDWK